MKVKNLFLTSISLCCIALPAALFAEKIKIDQYSDSRGESEVVICSQNLNNYGEPSLVKTRSGLGKDQFDIKENALVKRFIKARCDVIVLQEILGKEEQQAIDGAKRLAARLLQHSGRKFEARVASEGDRVIRNGILVASDVAEILNAVTYTKVALPKIVPDEKPRFFERPPLEVQIEVRNKDQSLSGSRTLSIIGYHFKSQSGAKNDPTGMAFETTRMQMAEALRRILESRFSNSFSVGEPLLVVAGDRNANLDLASSKLLQGTLALPLFAFEGPCRLSKRGVPLCRAGVALPGKLFSVITGDKYASLLPGTYKYKNEYSFLDDIAMPAVSLPLARKFEQNEGEYSVGILNDFPEASDHSLIWVELNW